MCLLIGEFNLFTYKVIDDKKGILLFCYLFSMCHIFFDPQFLHTVFFCV